MLASPSQAPPGTAPLTLLNLRSIRLTDQQFYRLCLDNPELRLELTADRKLIIMAPTGSMTGWRNSKLNQRLANWAEADGSGLAFDSSTGFTLPNGARRSPDAAWIPYTRWQSLTPEQQAGFAPLCPDFVVELRSRDDSLTMLRDKLAEYMANGARLGWLLDPENRTVYVYHPGQAVEQLSEPTSITGDPVLPGFVFQLSDIW